MNSLPTEPGQGRSPRRAAPRAGRPAPRHWESEGRKLPAKVRKWAGRGLGGEVVRTNRSHQGDLRQVRLFLRFPPLYILDFTVYLLYFLALSPLSMPIQYLFKHYFMPLARETFTFKFSNIPQSLVCKQHMSVLQLLPLSEAVGIKPSHARRGRRGGGPGLRRGHRTARTAPGAVHPAGCRGGRAEQRVKHPPGPGTRLGKGLLFQRGSTQRAI